MANELFLLYERGSVKTTKEKEIVVTLFYDFVYRLLVNLEIDLKSSILEENNISTEKMTKSTFSRLISKSLEFNEEILPFKGVILHLSIIFNKINEELEKPTLRKIAQFIPDPTKSEKKVSEVDTEQLKENKYRILCSWNSGKKKPEDYMLKGFLTNLFGMNNSEEENGFEVVIFMFIFKLSMASNSIHKELKEHENFDVGSLKKIFNQYMIYHNLVTTELEQSKPSGS